MNIIARALLIVIGTVAIVLGIIGIIVPLLPTTPLILMGAACYVKSSDKLYRLLLRNKWLGGYIEDFQKRKGITLKNKIVSISILWISLGISLYMAIKSLWLSMIIVLIAASVTIVILSFKTL
ncbi:YbaN family protein [Neobacillus sp. LXY-4]|uniref:YbaN family protein n=1 Tax=Neobacillus sp. LXY-4 TaxID=3379826 RepID=UPI003EE34131